MLKSLLAMPIMIAFWLLVVFACSTALGCAVVIAGGLYFLTKVDWAPVVPQADEETPQGDYLRLMADGAPLAQKAVYAPSRAGKQSMLGRLIHTLRNSGQVLPMVVGRRHPVDGKPRGIAIADLAMAPHVLVAGATGSGKSVWLDTLIQTLTGLKSPSVLRMVYIDPKRVELAQHAQGPHTAAFATEKVEASHVLARLCDEMDKRYRALQTRGVKKIGDLGMGCPPRIVVIIDEFADLILPHDKSKAQRDLSQKLRGHLARLLALGRAAGIHLVLATQRPDRNVVDGLMKANVPTRIAFRVSGKVESRIILDKNGAEALKGKGDGLAKMSDGSEYAFQGIMLEDN